MLADQKKSLLTNFLGQVPEDVAARLAKAIEIDRLIGNTGLPHDEILNALRPKLTKVSAVTRTPSPQRFFCMPFEDLLVTVPPNSPKRKGRIARASIQPVWNWLSAELMPEQHAALTTGIRFAILNGRADDVQAKCAEFWRTASAVLKQALSSERAKSSVGKKLGHVSIAEDAVEMARVLGAAQAIRALQESLPKPLPSLEDEHLLAARAVYDQLVGSDPDAAPFVTLVTMRRLAKPYEALRLAAVVSKRTTDTLISSTDLGVAGEILFDEMDALAAKIQTAKGADFDINALLESLTAFVDLSSGIVKEIGIRRDGAWGQRLAKSRSAVSATVEALLDRAPKEIAAALPGRRGAGLGFHPLDLTHAPNGDRVVRAMRFACLMAHVKPFAAAASFNAKLNDALDKVSADLRPTAEELLEAARAPEPEVFADQFFEIAVDLVTQVLGLEEADMLRRRARVAAA